MNEDQKKDAEYELEITISEAQFMLSRLLQTHNWDSPALNERQFAIPTEKFVGNSLIMIASYNQKNSNNHVAFEAGSVQWIFATPDMIDKIEITLFKGSARLVSHSFAEGGCIDDASLNNSFSMTAPESITAWTEYIEQQL